MYTTKITIIIHILIFIIVFNMPLNKNLSCYLFAVLPFYTCGSAAFAMR